MHIRLTKNNELRLKELCGLYRKMCSAYDVSDSGQCNLLLAGRLTVAISEAKLEMKKNKKCCHHD